MRKYGWKLGDHIMLKGSVYPVNASLLVGNALNERAPPDALLFYRDYLDEILGSDASGRINVYYAIADRKENVPAAIASVDETFANSSTETNSASEANRVSSFF